MKIDMFWFVDIPINADHPRYIESNTGCKHFDVHGGPENVPVSRFSFDAKVYTQMRGSSCIIYVNLLFFTWSVYRSQNVIGG